MKKSLKKVLSMVLTLAMAAGVVSGAGNVNSAKAETVAMVTPAVVTDFASLPTPAQATVTLQGKNAQTQIPNVIVPIRVEKRGVIEIGATVTTGAAASIEMGFFSDQNCTKSAGSSTTIASGSTQVIDKTFTVETAATYYVRFKWSSTVPAGAATIKMLAYAYSGTEMTLTSTFQPVFNGDGVNTLYHKLNVKKTGFVAICGNEYRESGTSLMASSLSFKIRNAKKKALHNGYLSSLNNYTEKYALKKGTYYVAVTSSQRYQLKAESRAWKDQGGKSKKKAKTIKRGKSANGTVLLTEGTKKADWYKIKLPKKSKMKIKIATACTGTASVMKVQIIPANRHYTLINSSSLVADKGKTLASRNKLKAGTYYIKVTKLTKSTSGVYRIKFMK